MTDTSVETETEITTDDLAIIPKPKGYKILIAIPKAEEKTAGGIYKPDILLDMEKTASLFGRVMAMGDLAYRDENKFPTGPYCKVGDWVMFKAYSGTRFRINGEELRLINDDTIEAVVEDPRRIQRA